MITGKILSQVFLFLLNWSLRFRGVRVSEIYFNVREPTEELYYLNMLLAPLLALNLCSWAISYDSSTMIQYSVWEELPVGTRVGCLSDDLQQTDEGGQLEDFQVVEQEKALLVSVRARDGLVSTQGHMNREELCQGSDLCEVAFSVLYRKNGAINYLQVRVEVMDLNDHSPNFPSASQEVEISETAGLGMQIPLDRALDPDAGSNGLQTYSLSANQHFALDVTTSPGEAKQPELRVIKELDREVQASFHLILTAWDKGNPPRSGSTLVHINIQDSNDNTPTFEDSCPTVELREDTALGTNVINLKATDPDQGANGKVEYSFSKYTCQEVQRLFYVDQQTGAVSVKALLDYEAQSSYELIIQANDKGPNSIPSHCKVHVKLLDVNDNAPRIRMTWTPPNSPGAEVLEGAPIGTFVALVTVSDADTGKNGAVNLIIKEDSGPFYLKQIHNDNYMIITAEKLDREKVMHYNITVIAQDEGSPPLSFVNYLLVSVLDENDNPPMFFTSVYKASIKENNKPGIHALKIKAYDLDLDLSGKVSYYLSNDIESPKVFSVHPKTGIISIQQPLDYEKSKTYVFIVEAVDHGHPPLTSTATVQIDVEDVNDNSPVIKEPKPRQGVASLSIPISAHKGEIVTELGNNIEEEKEETRNLTDSHFTREGHFGFLASTIKAEDADSGVNGKLKYQITDKNLSRVIWLDESTGHLFVNTSNATELIGKTLTVDITVSDMGSPSLSTKATLEMTFINLKDRLKNLPHRNRQLNFTMMMAICLGGTFLLLLLAITLLMAFCRLQKRDNMAYNCRQAESNYASHPRRPMKKIRKSDIQLIPVIQGRKEVPLKTNDKGQPLTHSPPMDQPTERLYNIVQSAINIGLEPQKYLEGEVDQHSKTLWNPEKIQLDGALLLIPATSYHTLGKSSSYSSSSLISHSSTLKHQYHPKGSEVDLAHSASEATLRTPKTLKGRALHDADHQRMLQNLVRLSMAVFGDSIELSSTSPEVQQISQLLSLLRQGRLQPKPNFRGNKYSHRNGRYGGQDYSNWQSTKDSGKGESEAGDVDWEPGRDSPIDPQLEEGLNHLFNAPDDVFSDISDPFSMARMSFPPTSDYHHNIFVPSGCRPSENEHLPQNGLDSSSCFSTFGKIPEKDSQLSGALLSEVSTLFEMLMTQKTEAYPGPRPNILYRLSAVYSHSLGLGGVANTTANMTPIADNAANHGNS